MANLLLSHGADPGAPNSRHRRFAAFGVNLDEIYRSLSSARIWCSSYRVPATAEGGTADPLHVCGSQRDAQRAERLGELCPCACANQRHDGRSLGKHPGNRQLRSRRTFSVAIWRIASTRRSFRSRFSPVKRGR